MNRPERAKTIASNGEIIPKPYGAGRWTSPRRYDCGHGGCPNPATTLTRAGTHPVNDGDDDRPHNCCGQHSS